MSMTLADQFYIRQKDILDKAELVGVAVLGCGASGSGVGIQLAKLGVPMLELYDGDTVEEHNLPNQYFPNSSLGQNKATALKRVIEQYTPMELLPMVVAHDKYFGEGDRLTSEIVFLCVDGFDNMRRVFNRILRENRGVNWVIATRMGAEYFEVWNINMKNEEEVAIYLESLEGESMPLPCTGRSVIYNVMAIGAFALATFRKLMKKGEYERQPYMIGYDLGSNMQIIKNRDDMRLIRL